MCAGSCRSLQALYALPSLLKLHAAEVSCRPGASTDPCGGKTSVCLALLAALRNAGLKARGLESTKHVVISWDGKPVIHHAKLSITGWWFEIFFNFPLNLGMIIELTTGTTIFLGWL